MTNSLELKKLAGGDNRSSIKWTNAVAGGVGGEERFTFYTKFFSFFFLNTLFLYMLPQNYNVPLFKHNFSFLIFYFTYILPHFLLINVIY